MTKTPTPVNGLDSAWASGYSSGLESASKEMSRLTCRIAELEAQAAEHEKLVNDLETNMAFIKAEVANLDQTKQDSNSPELLSAAKSILSMLNAVKIILEVHGSSFPVTENLAVLNLKTAIRKAEGLE